MAQSAGRPTGDQRAASTSEKCSAAFNFPNLRFDPVAQGFEFGTLLWISFCGLHGSPGLISGTIA
jgi:hypothetical protein